MSTILNLQLRAPRYYSSVVNGKLSQNHSNFSPKLDKDDAISLPPKVRNKTYPAIGCSS